MPIIRRCCCLRDLRKASFLCSGWTFVWSACALGLSANQLHEDTLGNLFKSYEIEGVLITWGSIGSAVAVMVTSLVLLVGILKDLWQLMVPWMVAVVLLIVLDVAVLIFNTIVIGFFSFSVVVMLLWIASTTVNVFCELCVVSHFQEVRVGRGHTDDYLNSSMSNGHVTAYATDVNEVLLTNEQWTTSSTASSGVSSPRMANGHDVHLMYDHVTATHENEVAKDKDMAGAPSATHVTS